MFWDLMMEQVNGRCPGLFIATRVTDGSSKDTAPRMPVRSSPTTLLEK